MNNLGSLKIGYKLQKLRPEKNMSQAEFATLLDIPTSTYQRYESNDTAVNMKKVVEFAEKLGVPLHDFLPDVHALNGQSYNGYGAGIVFGDYYIYANADDSAKATNQETSALKERLFKLEAQNEALQNQIHELMELVKTLGKVG